MNLVPSDIADIKNMRDRKNKFYAEEVKYWNEYKPKFDLLFSNFYKVVLNSPFLNVFKKNSPINFFNTIQYQLKINDNSAADLQFKENILKQEYSNLMSSKIIFNGEEMCVTSLSKYFSDKKRIIRKKAHDCYNDFFYNHKENFDIIF